MTTKRRDTTHIDRAEKYAWGDPQEVQCAIVEALIDIAQSLRHIENALNDLPAQS